MSTLSSSNSQFECTAGCPTCGGASRKYLEVTKLAPKPTSAGWTTYGTVPAHCSN